MSQVYEYNVAMTCDGCKNAVDRVLKKLPEGKIQKVDYDVAGKKVYVTSDALSSDEILETIKKTNLDTAFVGIKANKSIS